ncbi:glypican-5-like isoform X1 [Solea senegalensis]|uniref:Glypican-5-like isoform X1 n=1 Tax=Solea senegalensis TaxID=28829 RepID=A0AAV6T4D7_SOLSE|nr:glypican-5-like isoform X1 [Solea senegalensis]KAG7524261.1 glypican-5-like isoform X1 [Solea senegalensis]
MSRGICPRVNSCGCFWIFSAVVFAVRVIDVESHSCHEVRTAFQLRQVGPLHRVPETPDTDVDLLICKHQGPSCCTRKMEENYQLAVKRETLHNIHSYSYELEHVISGHLDAFQDMFQYLLSFSQGHLSSLLEGAYPSLSRHALPHVNQLFSSLSLYLRGANVSVEATVHHFFNNLFPLVYTKLINPGIEGGMMVGSETGDCLRMIRQDVNPFGTHPTVMAQELAGALGAGRQLGLALEEGLEVMNATEHISLTKECVKGLVKMVYCSHCRGLTLIKPCVGYCLNVMRGCLASVSELDQSWRRYTSLLEQLTHAMAGHHSLELALLEVRGRVNKALLYAQLHGSIITATVDKVCGLSTEEPTTMQSTSPEVTTSTVTSSSPFPSAAPSQPLPEQWLGQLAHLRNSFPLKPSKNNKHSLKTLSRDFLMYLQRYKSFFAALPEMLCEGENMVDDFTCWGGEDVLESYTSRVVGNGLHAQRQNPEVKVRGADPTMAEVKEGLDHFNQETQEKFPKLGQVEVWDELGSGKSEGSSIGCDDEDGCQASGDDQDTSYIDASSEGRPIARQPGGDGPHVNPSKPPSVKVIGGSPPASWARPWSLALLLAALCMQWTLF